jgi:hypothetical protein
MVADSEVPNREVDARKFQSQLDELATTIALKVQREGTKHYLKPDFVTEDIYYLLRQAQQSYNFFFFLNADERRRKDCDWRPPYSVVTLPLVRTMIDCLYNVVAILENPGVKGVEFRASGLGRMLAAIDDDERRYGSDPQWQAWITFERDRINMVMRREGFTDSQVRSTSDWPTLGRYLGGEKNTQLSSQQEFLKKFTFGFWKEYSAISHATFQALLPLGAFLAPKDLEHELRPRAEAELDRLISRHISRVAAVLLCMVTEVQAYCHFDGARINQRLQEIWGVLLPISEIGELHAGRYEQLMREKGIVSE